jgi:peptidoglycan/xylan/chitin deacetylase (PgdA/CDA1 family)
MFHHFHDGKKHIEAEGSISPEDFVRALDAYGDHLLPAQEWLDRALAGRLSDGDVCLTFDDGLLCQAEVALPIMKERGVTAMWFVYSEPMLGEPLNFEMFRRFRTTQFEKVSDFCDAFVEVSQQKYEDVAEQLAEFTPSKYLAAFTFYTDGERTYRFLRDKVLGPDRHTAVMLDLFAARGYTLDQARRDLWINEGHVRQLAADGHVVGLHSYSHPTNLAGLAPSVQGEEYASNAAHLKSLTGVAPITVAHPVNSYTDDTLRVLSDLGVRIGFCTTMEPVGADTPLEWPREDSSYIRGRLRGQAA